MAKFYGNIGYGIPTEGKPGVWNDVMSKKPYSGDIIKNLNKWTTPTDGTNDNLVLNNQISIIADPYANQNFSFMKYVEFMGGVWKITNVEVLYPRLILSLGGVYNGKQA